MATKSRPTRQRPGASSGTATARKPAAKKKTTGENPFKKAAAGIADTTRAANANTTHAFVKATDKAAEATKSAARQAGRAADGMQQNAFQFGSQFNQATDWMRGQSESFKNIWQQALQGMPAMNAFGKQSGTTPKFGTASAMFGMDASRFTKMGDTTSRSMREMAALGTEHMQTMSECATATAGVAKGLSQEILQTANSLFADQMELGKAALACRNVDDMMELQGKASRLALETVFNESLRLSELAFKYAVDIAEPVQQSLAQAGERLTKIVATKAA